MASGMHRKWLVWIGAGALALVIAYAWVDGGRRPLREMSQDVAIPEARR